MLRGIVEVFAAASTGAAGPFYGTTGRRKQRVAAAELSVQQDLSKDHDSPGAADAAVDSDGAAVPSEELRAGTDPPDGYVDNSAESIVELLALRLDEQGAELSTPWPQESGSLILEALWPQVWDAWRAK